MTTPSYDLSKAQILSTLTLPKSGDSCTLVLQGPEHIDHMLALQQTIYDDLPDNAKSFIVPKDRAFFEKHFQHGNHMVGIIHNGKLIAQGILVHPTAAYPQTGMVDMNLNAAAYEVAVIQGLLVHPDYRGNSLMSVMVDARLKIADAANRKHLVAEVSVDNPHSWAVLMKEGLAIHSIGVDHSDGTLVYNMHSEIKPLVKKRLGNIFNKSALHKSAKTVHHTDLKKQKKLIGKGYAGVAFDHASGNITFVKTYPRNHLKRAPKLP